VEDKQIVVIEKNTKYLTEEAKAIVISTQDHYEKANEFLRAVKGLQKEIHATFDPIVSAAHKTHQEATSKRKEHLDPAISAERVVKGKMIAYDDKMEAIRRAEQRRIDAKAREEEERKRKELAARAEKWAAKGKIAKAEELQEQAEEVEVVAPVVAPKVEKIKGVSFKENWSAIVVDETKVPREYLQVNTMALNRIAKATKGSIKIPGVEFKMDKILASRGY